jgi:hypothetical protein
MKFYIPEKIEQMSPTKRKKNLTFAGAVILLDLILIAGFIFLKIAKHESLNTPYCIFASVVSVISLSAVISFWLIIWSAYKKIPYSEKRVLT